MWQFVGYIMVAWLAQAWLGVLQRRHGGAAWRWPGDGTPVVPWWRSLRCQVGVEAVDPPPPMLDLAVPGRDRLWWSS